MTLYADTPSLRTRQVLGDALAVVWVAAWVLVGRFVRDLVLTLAEPVSSLRSTGQGLGQAMRQGAGAVAGLPFVGDRLVAPFDEAAGTGDRIVSTSDALVARITEVAHWTGLLVAGVPVALGLAWWVARRVAFARRAALTRRFLDADADLELFALRAMAHQPLARLDAVSHDPVRAWRSGDAEVVRRLAALELADAGLRPPAPRVPLDPAGSAGPGATRGGR